MSEQLDEREKMPCAFLKFVCLMPKVAILAINHGMDDLDHQFSQLIKTQLLRTQVRLEFLGTPEFVIEAFSGRTLIFLLSRAFK